MALAIKQILTRNRVFKCHQQVSGTNYRYQYSEKQINCIHSNSVYRNINIEYEIVQYIESSYSFIIQLGFRIDATFTSIKYMFV